MTHPGEGALQALIDGELAPGPRAEAEAHLRSCGECAELVAQLRMEGARASALLGLTDVAAPVLPAQLAFQRRRRGRLAGFRQALPRAAALVVALAGVAAAAVVPGSPVREWVEGIGIAERPEAPEAVAPPPAPVTPAPALAPKAVSLAPAEGRIRVLVTGASPELRIRVRMADAPRAEVLATGAAASARFRTAPGRIEVVGAGPGEVVVHLPSSAGAASVEVGGRVVAAVEDGVLRALAPRVAGSAEEPVFRAGS